MVKLTSNEGLIYSNREKMSTNQDQSQQQDPYAQYVQQVQKYYLDLNESFRRSLENDVKVYREEIMRTRQETVDFLQEELKKFQQDLIKTRADTAVRKEVLAQCQALDQIQSRAVSSIETRRTKDRRVKRNVRVKRKVILDDDSDDDQPEGSKNRKDKDRNNYRKNRTKIRERDLLSAHRRKGTPESKLDKVLDNYRKGIRNSPDNI